MNIKDKLTNVVVDKLTRLVVSSILRTLTNPLSHRKWCKEHPRQMAIVENVARDINKQLSEATKNESKAE